MTTHSGTFGPATRDPATQPLDADAARRDSHPPQPIPPRRPAPARFGQAGISAGETWRIKETVTLPRGLFRRPPSLDGHEPTSALANGLGMFSIALGVTEVLAGRNLAHWLGMPNSTGLIRFYGLREIGNGVAILMQDHPRDQAPWVWARVGGDALDLATLAPSASDDNPRRDNVSAALTAVLAVTAIDILCGLMLTRR